MTEEEISKLEEEGWAVSEMMMRTTPSVNHNGVGFLTRREKALGLPGRDTSDKPMMVDDLCYTYLHLKAAAEHKEPGEILRELIVDKLFEDAPDIPDTGISEIPEAPAAYRAKLEPMCEVAESGPAYQPKAGAKR
ncbi:MAG: hypothetical protein FWC23_01970 [Chitinispirillia bacterium]|nr:hypothetical protein [Chitinispirillia bacterium]MCL2267945.1 hypothetical protein [Chitinispirillia bacterium]